MKSLIKTIKKYFTIWWIPLIIYFLSILLFQLGLNLRSDKIINIFIIMFLTNTIGLLISSITQIVIKKWYYIIPQMIVGFFLFFSFLMVFTFSPPDFYGAHKTIPNNIEISKPIDKEPSSDEFEKNNLVIANDFQPGMYRYYTNYKPKESGYFYIKAFEINSNDKLSEKRIKEKSKVNTNKLNENGLYSGEFTIYEGSWGDKYAGRIELWFHPTNGDKEYKITERNYIIEGWMR